MPRLPYLLLVLHCPLLLAGEIDGHYHATLDGMPAEMILSQTGEKVQGQYVENGRLRLNVKGRYDGTLLRLEISEPKSGLVIANMNANFANAMLNTSIAARDPRSGEVQERQALFQRQPQTAPPAQATSNGQDPALVGTWIHEKIINSGGASFASLNTLMTLQLGADGKVTQWSRSAGGGSDWSYDSPGEVQYAGRWRSENGLLMVHLDGTADYQPAAYYSFSEQYLVTESNTGKMTWQRRQ